MSPEGIEPSTNRLRAISPAPLLALQAQGMWWAQRRAVLSPKGPNNQVIVGTHPAPTHEAQNRGESHTNRDWDFQDGCCCRANVRQPG